MSDSDAAYGIYQFKTSLSGKEITILDAKGKLQDYYLNLWKGKFKITLIGFYNQKDTIPGLKKLAEEVLKTLPAKPAPPPDLIYIIRKISPNPFIFSIMAVRPSPFLRQFVHNCPPVFSVHLTALNSCAGICIRETHEN